MNLWLDLHPVGVSEGSISAPLPVGNLGTFKEGLLDRLLDNCK
jgi:hypothetical protein